MLARYNHPVKCSLFSAFVCSVWTKSMLGHDNYSVDMCTIPGTQRGKPRGGSHFWSLNFTPRDLVMLSYVRWGGRLDDLSLPKRFAESRSDFVPD